MRTEAPPVTDRTTLERVDAGEWLHEARRFADLTFQQHPAYVETLAKRQGASCEFALVRQAGDIVAAAGVRIKRLPITGGGLAFISGGPLVRRPDSGVDAAEALRTALAALEEEYVRRQGLVLRATGPADLPPWEERARAAYVQGGFEAADRGAPYRAIVLDVTQSEEELRRQMSGEWRNNLGRAAKRGATVRALEPGEDWSPFIKTFDAFRRRKSFDTDLDAEFFAQVDRKLEGDERFAITLAEREGEVVAGHAMSLLGDTAVYVLGAILPEGMKCSAGYLLQWTAMMEAKRRGMRLYDLGGIDPEDNPSVTRFKLGTGGADVQAPGPFELRPRGLRASLVGVAESLHRRMRRRSA